MNSRKKNSKKATQRIYKMRGCNKSGCKKKSRKRYLGGSSYADINLAYPANIQSVPNPHLAYTQNKHGGNSAYPAKDPPPGFNFINSQSTQRGGFNCGIKIGGGKKMTGGSGNNGIPYPNGLVGSGWTPAISGWPGVDGIDGNRNYLELNKYPTDPQTSMINVGAQPPFTGGSKKRKNVKKGKKMVQKGGALSNFFFQDLINLGRQFQYGVGSTYNSLTGYPSPVNPMPWKGQLPNTPSLSSVRSII